MGKYKNHIKDDDRYSDLDGIEDNHSNENQKTDDIDDYNRVERQLINQILSQIESKKYHLVNMV